MNGYFPPPAPQCPRGHIGVINKTTGEAKCSLFPVDLAGIPLEITTPVIPKPELFDRPIGAYLTETGEIVDVTRDIGIIRTAKETVPLTKITGALIVCFILYGAYKLLKRR